jgi:hypothetical protein
LLETVGQREKYFGIRLEGVDADVFAFKTLALAVTNWELFSVEFVTRVRAEIERRVAVEVASSL